MLQGLLPLPLEVAVNLALFVYVCLCARLTHSFKGGVLVEPHCAVVAVRVWKSLSKGSVGGVIQMVLFWLETSTHVDALRC